MDIGDKVIIAMFDEDERNKLNTLFDEATTELYENVTDDPFIYHHGNEYVTDEMKRMLTGRGYTFLPTDIEYLAYSFCQFVI
jgi:hypothetical protein